MSQVSAPSTASKRTLSRSKLHVLATTAILCVTSSAYAQDPKPIFPIPQIPVTLDGAYIGPGRGLTGNFEIQFMESTIDHHYSALRMTELAAGTAPQRQTAVASGDGVAATPGYSPSAAKANLDDLKSMARQANRTQREEILTLQTYLRDWYGIAYQPKIAPENATQIQLLESTPPGNQFDQVFYETFSRHHYTLLDPLNQCLTGSDLAHPDLVSLCSVMWHSQSSEIMSMRRDLARHFTIVDYQPFTDPSGQHSAIQR